MLSWCKGTFRFVPGVRFLYSPMDLLLVVFVVFSCMFGVPFGCAWVLWHGFWVTYACASFWCSGWVSGDLWVSFGCYIVRAGSGDFRRHPALVYLPRRIVRSGSLALVAILWVGCLCKYVVVRMRDYLGLALLCTLLLLATPTRRLDGCALLPPRTQLESYCTCEKCNLS